MNVAVAPAFLAAGARTVAMGDAFDDDAALDAIRAHLAASASSTPA